jgi:zinc D-Ala-D-Ala carboxypeptidase
MNLSKYFTLRELTRTDIRVPNDPTPVVIERLTALCVNVLDAVREHFGCAIRVSSGYRCSAVNTRVGGAADSQHVKGEAADFEAVNPGVDHLMIARFIAHTLVFDQLIIEFCTCAKTGMAECSGWIHCSYVTHRAPRKSILIARRVRDGNSGRLWTQYQRITAEAIPTAKG